MTVSHCIELRKKILASCKNNYLYFDNVIPIVRKKFKPAEFVEVFFALFQIQSIYRTTDRREFTADNFNSNSTGATNPPTVTILSKIPHHRLTNRELQTRLGCPFFELHNNCVNTFPRVRIANCIRDLCDGRHARTKYHLGFLCPINHTLVDCRLGVKAPVRVLH